MEQETMLRQDLLLKRIINFVSPDHSNDHVRELEESKRLHSVLTEPTKPDPSVAGPSGAPAVINIHSTQTVLSETSNKFTDYDKSIIDPHDASSSRHNHTQQALVDTETFKQTLALTQKAQLDTATFKQLLNIYPGIDKNFVIAEYEMCADFAGLVDRISEMGDYPMTDEISIQNPYYPEQLQCLVNVFPDADEKFLDEKSMLNKIEFEKFVHDTLQNNTYPRRQAEKKETKSSDDDLRLFTTAFSVENFLRVIPDPFQYYTDEKRLCTYSIHGWQFLKRRYRHKNSYYTKELNEVYTKFNFNLSLTCNYLDTNKPKLRKKRATISNELWMPESVNILFLKEACFIEHKAEIKAYLDEEAEAKDKEFQEAKAKGGLIECGCCYDQVTFNNCVSCANGDLFCTQCLKKSSEIRIGEGLTNFPCLQDCGGEFSLQLLGNLLNPQLFSKVLNQIQISEVKAANIEGLEECPFCQFATIPPADTNIFNCLNPECLKESCRQCRKPSHIPLRCKEVETDKQTEARKFLEDEMTKALVRECYRCKKPFIKTDGCNKMTCSCGAKMCYVCRQPVRDYTHFNGQGGTEFDKCPLYTTDKLLHVDAVKARAEQALKELNVNLLFDPTKILPDASKARTVLPFGIVQNEHLVLQRAAGIHQQPVENNGGGVQIQQLENIAGGVHIQPHQL